MGMGTWKYFTIWTNLGSFSLQSSIVTNTTLSVSGTCENTVGSVALSVIGLTAGGGGAGADGFRPRYRWLISSASTPAAAAAEVPALAPVLVPLGGQLGARTRTLAVGA